MTPRLIGLDWGTTSCRAYLIGDGGAILARIDDGPRHPARREPGVRSGSRYPDRRLALDTWFVADRSLRHDRQSAGLGRSPLHAACCPASVDDIASGLAHIEQGNRAVAVVAGISTVSHGMPDVLRGEETQILGALATSSGDGLFLLPGTHSKWAEVRDGRVRWFRTFMTGEVFAALKEHTILGRLTCSKENSTRTPLPAAWSKGPAWREAVRFSIGFATRTYGLMNRLRRYRSRRLSQRPAQGGRDRRSGATRMRQL